MHAASVNPVDFKIRDGEINGGEGDDYGQRPESRPGALARRRRSRRLQLLEVSGIEVGGIVGQHLDAAEPVESSPHRHLGIGAAGEVNLTASRSFD
jgi:hypothetical protein